MRRWFIRWLLPLQLLSLVFGLIAASLTGCPLKCCHHESATNQPQYQTHDEHADESHHFCSFVFCSSGSGFLLAELHPPLQSHAAAGMVIVQDEILISRHQSDFFRPPIFVS